MFSDKEIAYLNSQRLARIATASVEGRPDVAPVGFSFDGPASDEEASTGVSAAVAVAQKPFR